MNKKKKNKIIIISLILFLGISQFFFILSTSSRQVWQYKPPESELESGDQTINLPLNIFVLDNYDLYIIVKFGYFPRSLIGTISFMNIDPSNEFHYNYQINPSESSTLPEKKSLIINIQIPPGEYYVYWQNIEYESDYEFILTTHGLLNFFPDYNSPSFFEIILIILSTIILIISIIGALLNYKKYKNDKTEFINFMNQTLEEIDSTQPNNESENNLLPGNIQRKKNKEKTSIELITNQNNDLDELDNTESEMEIQEMEFTCIVHKGPIIGPNYLCPHCKTFYCLNCANMLKEKGETCWSCHKEIY